MRQLRTTPEALPTISPMPDIKNNRDTSHKAIGMIRNLLIDFTWTKSSLAILIFIISTLFFMIALAPTAHLQPPALLLRIILQLFVSQLIFQYSYSPMITQK